MLTGLLLQTILLKTAFNKSKATGTADAWKQQDGPLSQSCQLNTVSRTSPCSGYHERPIVDGLTGSLIYVP